MAQPRFQLVPGARLASSDGTAGIGWRLLGANNRELGRSALASPDAESALSGDAHIVHDPRTGHWAWHLDDDGEVVATSGRGFRHERECRYNLEQFREAAPTAPAADTDVPTEFPWQRTVAVPLPSEATP